MKNKNIKRKEFLAKNMPLYIQSYKSKIFKKTLRKLNYN